ncbi:hypothetical protein KUCAC02_019243, partial [Chaenocephalus aceratus]
MKHPLPTASTSSNASSTSEQRTAVSTGQRQTSIIDFSKRPVTDKRRQQITDLLINFVVKDVRPLSALSGEGFRDIMKFFEPGYKIPSHATLWSNIMLQYNTVKARIVNEMKDKSVSLTTDLWTSCTMDPYITITAHYITDTWEIKSRVLRGLHESTESALLKRSSRCDVSRLQRRAASLREGPAIESFGSGLP